MAGFIETTRTFFEDVRDQMQKVTWPDWPQLKNSTFVITIFVIVLAIVIWVMDMSVNFGLEQIRSLAGG